MSLIACLRHSRLSIRAHKSTTVTGTLCRTKATTLLVKSVRLTRHQFTFSSLVTRSRSLFPGLLSSTRLFTTNTPAQDSQSRPLKPVSESRVERYIALSKDERLRDLYINSWGEVRIGLILEELDRLAGAVAYKHALGAATEVVGLQSLFRGQTVNDSHNGHPSGDVGYGFTPQSMPIVIVTAGVDSIVLYRPLAITNDLHIEGRVVMVGRSSMEVLLEVDSIREMANGEKKRERAIEAHFTMVARSPAGDKAVMIPDLKIETDEERVRYERAKLARERRKRSLDTSIYTKLPTPDEHRLLHKLFYDVHDGDTTALPPVNTKLFGIEKGKDLSQGYCTMERTFRSSVFVMQPQKRNIHNKVFGGYLMRLAFEQAWCSAYMFSGTLPSFIACDDIAFILPVALGTMVSFDNTVVYSRQIKDGRHEVVVECKANVLHPATHTHETTNTFFYFFRVAKCDFQVIPSSYQEAMKWLDGKRRLEAITEARSSFV